MKEIYGYQVSDSSITRITKILPLVKEWQTRPLEAIYPIVFMDAIHYHVRSEGQIVKKAVYIAIGISSSGENESAKFWLSKLNELKSRGVEDILIACVDGLTGFSNAIEAVYPQTQIQQCIIHQIRSSTQFVSYKDIKVLIADLKLVYKVTTEESALLNLELFDEKWGKKYPKIAISWKNKTLQRNGQVVKEIGVKLYRSFKYILKEEFKFKCMKV
ncbi:MAG: IS256 family transposase [Cetobacterium sp.]|uniref:IS256 family transposase n=1 Tax=Cetobacterium sp. TaxID=2071632 RepID=UPI003F3E7C41